VGKFVEGGSNWPKISPPLQKINIANKACIGYLDSYWFDLIDASISWTATEADTQFAIFA
jgi:hypothetical protein